MRRRAAILTALTLLFIGGAIYGVQMRLDSLRGGKAAQEEFLYLPEPEHIRIASLGYEQFVSDILWLKAIQHIGERNITGQGYDWIYKALDTVTSLDPRFVTPYEMGGLTLTMLAEKVDLSNKLLIKGVENNPDVWQFPFYLGFNYLFYTKDYREAAKYMAKAASLPGSPWYLPLLASRLYVQAEDPAYAYEFLGRMYDSTGDENVRAAILRRMDLLKNAKGGKTKETLGIYTRGGR